MPKAQPGESALSYSANRASIFLKRIHPEVLLNRVGEAGITQQHHNGNGQGPSRRKRDRSQSADGPFLLLQREENGRYHAAEADVKKKHLWEVKEISFRGPEGDTYYFDEETGIDKI